MIKEPKRILHIMGPVITGGVDTLVMNYYRHIDHDKIQFDFIFDGYHDTPIDKEIESYGGKIYKVSPYSDGMYKSIKEIYKVIKENNYEVVHSHMNSLSVFPLMAAKIAGAKIRIAHSHSTATKDEVKKSIMKYSLRPFSKVFPTHYCTCSKKAGEWLFGKHFYKKGKVKLVKNAIDVDKFIYNKEIRNRVRKELGISDKFVIGNIGRFAYQKNHDFLIDIFNEVYRIDKDAVLLLIGDGELRDSIKEKIDRLGLSKNVMFLGIRQDVYNIIQAMDVFLFPTRYEGLGIVVIEAQANGLSTIASEAIPKEAVINELFEYCSLNEDAKKWADKVLKARNTIRLDRSESVIKAGYEMKSAARELIEWYEQLLL